MLIDRETLLSNLSKFLVKNHYVVYSNRDVEQIKEVIQNQLLDIDYQDDYCRYLDLVEDNQLDLLAKCSILDEDLDSFSNNELLQIAIIFDLESNNKYSFDEGEKKSSKKSCEICSIESVSNIGDICPVCGWEVGPITCDAMSLVNSNADGSPAFVNQTRKNWLKNESFIIGNSSNSLFWMKLYNIIDKSAN